MTTVERRSLRDADYRLIVETTSEGVWALDLEGRTIFVNDAMASMLGFTVEEIDGRFLWQFIPDAEQALAVSNFEEVVGGLRGQLELRVPRKDGTKIWILVSVSPLLDEDGSTVGALGMATNIDERKRTEYERRTAEERYRALAENLPVIMYQAPLEGHRASAYISPQCKDLLGYSAEEWIADPTLYQHVLHPDDRERVLAELEEANRTRAPFSAEYRMVARDGRVVWVRDESIPVSSNGDEYALGFVVDVTAQKESERRLEAQHQVASILAERPMLEDGCKGVLEAVCRSLDLDVGAIWRVDPDAEVLRNIEVWHLPDVEAPRFEAMTRSVFFARGAGLPGRVWQAAEPVWVPMIDGDPTLPRASVALREGLRGAFGVPISVRSEVIGVIEFFSAQIAEPNAELMQMMGVLGGQLGQFFERADAKAELVEAEERYRRLAEQLPLVTYIAPLKGYSPTIYVSPQIEALTGYAPDEWQSDPHLFEKLLHPDDRDRVLAALDDTIATRSDFSQEYRLIARDGRVVCVRDESVTVRDENGVPLYAEGYFLDLTERKQLEDELRQAQKMEAVGRLAGGIAHDFNNLLLAIRGYSELALAELDRLETDGEARESIEQVKLAGERASALTAQLLAFSRKQVLRPEVVDLNALVREIEGLARGVVPESIQLVVSLDVDVCPVKVDRGQMEQAIMNLLINARDAIIGSGRVTLSTSRAELGRDEAEERGLQPGAYVTLSVSDTGMGMDEETRERIFEPFFTTKGSKGTGLGLSTVYGFVKQSRGVVAVDSERRQGSTFTIYLPYCAEPLGPSPNGGPGRAARGSETVLLVEDESEVRHLLAKVLRRDGYTVLEAEKGAEAFRLAESHQGPIHVVVTDSVLPDIGGRAAAERLSVLRPGAKVVHMSGYTADRAVEAADVFLQKPFAPATLAQTIRRVLDET